MEVTLVTLLYRAWSPFLIEENSTMVLSSFIFVSSVSPTSGSFLTIKKKRGEKNDR